MNSILVNPISTNQSFATLAKRYAGIIDSRESTYRTALDVTGFSLPIIVASAFRNVWNFLESLFEGTIDIAMIAFAPQITNLTGKIFGELTLDKNEKKDYLKYLYFQMPELDNIETFKNGLERIKNQETKDKLRIAELYKLAGKYEQAKQYEEQAKNTENFANNFICSEEKRQKIKKLKKSVIIGQSALEGFLWGNKHYFVRMFRKHILGKEHFTGTSSYLDEGEVELHPLQKLGMAVTQVISPLLTWFLLNQAEKPEKRKESKFFSVVHNQLDMTHGLFPKLGLLFNYLQVPVLLGAISNAQGKYEIAEKIIRDLNLVGSWWFGHRATNGLVALNADKNLEKEFGKKGILVEKDVYEKSTSDGFWTKLGKNLPEPTRIQHVLDETEGNEKLRERAVNEHAKSLYLGFGLHSALVCLNMMAVAWLTKLRVKFDQGS